MKFDIFGRKELEVIRSNGRWQVYYCGGGLKRKADDIHIPPSVSEDELEEYIVDVFHEQATPDYPKVRKL